MADDDAMADEETAAGVTSGAPEGSFLKALAGSCLAAFAARGGCNWAVGAGL